MPVQKMSMTKTVLKRTSFQVSFGIYARPRRRKGRASSAATASAISKAVQKPGEDEDEEGAEASSDWQVRARHVIAMFLGIVQPSIKR